MITPSASTQGAPTPEQQAPRDLAELAAQGCLRRANSPACSSRPPAPSRGSWRLVRPAASTCSMWLPVRTRSSPSSTTCSSKRPTGEVSGGTLYLNGDGGLWAFPLDSPDKPRRIGSRGPAGHQQRPRARPRRRAHLRVGDGRPHLSRALTGGTVQRVTTTRMGVALPARRLARREALGYVRIGTSVSPSGSPDLAPEAGDRRRGTAPANLDGPEWSPAANDLPQHRGAARRPGPRPTGAIPQRGTPPRTRSAAAPAAITVDWFPAPIARREAWRCYIAYPAGTGVTRRTSTWSCASS